MLRLFEGFFYILQFVAMALFYVPRFSAFRRLHYMENVGFFEVLSMFFRRSLGVKRQDSDFLT